MTVLELLKTLIFLPNVLLFIPRLLYLFLFFCIFAGNHILSVQSLQDFHTELLGVVSDADSSHSAEVSLSFTIWCLVINVGAYTQERVHTLSKECIHLVKGAYT